jgi:hypothetical protein
MIHATGEYAHRILDSLKATPALLLLVILNGLFLLTAGWFLLKQEEYRNIERLEIVQLLGRCLSPKQ